MHQIMARNSTWLLVAAAVAIAGCGSRTYRGEHLDDRELNAALAFLREPGASRAMVEARFGSPQVTFEQGRVVAYFASAIVQQGPWRSPAEWRAQPFGPDFTAQPLSPGQRGHQLMIEYDQDGNVLRHNVLQ